MVRVIKKSSSNMSSKNSSSKDSCCGSSSSKMDSSCCGPSSSKMSSIHTSLSKTIGGKKIKRKLSEAEEFSLMLLVLDKFLWLGFGIMAFGLYIVVTTPEHLGKWLLFMASGAVILILFMVMLLKEFEMNK